MILFCFAQKWGEWPMHKYEPRRVLEKLIEERNEIADRVFKIDGILTSYNDISETQLTFMKIQVSTMNAYWTVLDERIADLKKQIDSNK